jgi:hypothetical protein
MCCFLHDEALTGSRYSDAFRDLAADDRFKLLIRELSDIACLDACLFPLAEVLLSEPDEHCDIAVEGGPNLPAP